MQEFVVTVVSLYKCVIPCWSRLGTSYLGRLVFSTVSNSSMVPRGISANVIPVPPQAATPFMGSAKGPRTGWILPAAQPFS